MTIIGWQPVAENFELEVPGLGEMRFQPPLEGTAPQQIVLVVPLEIVGLRGGRRGIENKIDRATLDAFIERRFIVDEVPVLQRPIEKRPSFLQIRGLPGCESCQIENPMSRSASTTVQVLPSCWYRLPMPVRMLFSRRTQQQTARLYCITGYHDDSGFDAQALLPWPSK